MIDENMLKAMENAITIAPHLGGSFIELRGDDRGLELIRLARLGLWAEKQGIPFLNEFIPLVAKMHLDGRLHDANTYMLKERGREILAALPKDER